MQKSSSDLFSRIFESSREFKKVTTITTCAMFGALSVVLGYYSFKITPNLKIGFGSIPNMLVDYLFGPVVGGLFGGAMDVIKFMLKPDGGFMPGFTFNAMLAAFIYGLFFYKKNLSLPRILTAKLVVIVLCNIVLGTYWLTLLNGKGFLAILPARAIKNLIQWPVDSLIFFLVAKTLEQAGVFKLILHAGNRQRRLYKSAADDLFRMHRSKKMLSAAILTICCKEHFFNPFYPLSNFQVNRQVHLRFSPVCGSSIWKP